MIWTAWWAWLAGALILGILETLAPGFIMLGFAVGAAVIGVLFGIGGPFGTWLAGSLPVTLVVFALASLIAWIVMRRVLGRYRNKPKVWDTDIND